MSKRLFYLLMAYFTSADVSGQVLAPDSNVYTAKLNSIELYYQSLGHQSPIYNGSEYVAYPGFIEEGHVFFETNSFVKATVGFDGMVFHDIPVLYDLLKDQLIIQHYTHLYNITLAPGKADHFVINNHTFIYLPADSEGKIKPGFYEQLYNGKTIAFEKRIKTITEEHSTTQITNTVRQKVFYYIKKEGKYYIINNTRGLLNVLKYKKKEVQQNLNKNHLKFKEQPEQTLAKALQVYDQLTD